MEEGIVQQYAEAHAEAVVRGDMDHATADFVEEMRPQVPEIAKSLPLPVATAEVESIDAGEDSSTVEIRYDGQDGRTQRIRTVWEDRGERPLIVGGEPID
jgi:hypothetical protein